ARGDRPADTLLTNARLVNVFTGEILETELALAGGRVAGVGPGYEAAETVDLGGRCVAPGLIDAHVHIESSMVRPAEFARAVVPAGVTTVITDPHEIANVCGLAGMLYMLRDAEAVPLEVFVNASSCVPATDLGTAGASLGAEDLASLLSEPRVLGLAEVMNFPGVIAGDPSVLAKLRAFEGRVLDGHAPGLSGKPLNAYTATGISSDHEATTLEEAREKLRLGMTVFLREATNAHNLRDLLPLVDSWTEPSLCFATDDRVPADLLDEGSVDHMVRVAVREGVEPMAALRMATLNPARHYRLHDRGALVPGRRADLVVFSDPADFRAEEVWVAGVKVAAGGEALFDAPAGDAVTARDTVDVDVDGLDFRIAPPEERPEGGGTIRVIGAIPDQLLTEHLSVEPKMEGGSAVADPERDLLKIAVVERHAGSGRTGLGFIRGFGLQRGALAGTFAHDHHNLVVIGADDRSMEAAARAVVEAGGGLAVADGGRVVEVLPLPIAGLMAEAPVEEVRATLDRLLDAAREMGSSLHDPFMAMSFVTLEVIPSLKITDRGLVDVETFELVPLFA
ncbi:MAG: adenine deaminase, partial [Acidobacteriota bacterium]